MFHFIVGMFLSFVIMSQSHIINVSFTAHQKSADYVISWCIIYNSVHVRNVDFFTCVCVRACVCAWLGACVSCIHSHDLCNKNVSLCFLGVCFPTVTGHCMISLSALTSVIQHINVVVPLCADGSILWLCHYKKQFISFHHLVTCIKCICIVNWHQWADLTN